MFSGAQLNSGTFINVKDLPLMAAYKLLIF
jgi:hypothetical protein